MLATLSPHQDDFPFAVLVVTDEDRDDFVGEFASMHHY